MPLATRVLPLATALGVLCFGALGVWLLLNFDPNVQGGPFPPCIFHALTGYWCIGCGMTRALHALVHGHVLQAFGMNPLAMAILAISPLPLAWRLGWRRPWMRTPIAWLSEPRLWLVLLPAYWIARNLPWPAFSWMAPG